MVELNELLVNKFVEVFGKDDNINDTDPTNDFTIPIVPTFGNNDIMPHNIFHPGPNWWTKKFLHIWNKFIPEEQRHGFDRGGWFFVEVIPKQLAVFSLNTIYFFENNAAVDGCAKKSEPGYEHMEWLRIQLQFLRERGMKAIMMGHVPPARTEDKLSWDETCWQKYTLWMRQYRDVVVGSVYGHMNIDHFMLQDFDDISSKALEGKEIARMALDDELTIQSSAEYLTDLRAEWSQIPDPPKGKSSSRSGLGYFYDLFDTVTMRKRKPKSKEDRFLEKIGGKWGERYSVSLVSPSVIPNYFPTIRVIEYNISGLDARLSNEEGFCETTMVEKMQENQRLENSKSKSKKKHSKKSKFAIPDPPSKSAPPGPAYSPQTFSWLGYTQYYANLTKINNDFSRTEPTDIEDQKWHHGKNSGKKPKKKSKKHNQFHYEVEYDTRNDTIFGLEDLSVRSFVDLAGRIGQYKPRKGDLFDEAIAYNSEDDSGDARDEDVMSCHGTDLSASKKKHKKHGKKHKHRKIINKLWFTFVNRAYVGSRDDDDLHDEFGQHI